MKKSILIIALMLIGFGIKAMAGNKVDCYLKTHDTLYIGTNIRMGVIHTTIVTMDGSVAKVDNHDITGYRHHGKLYMLLPVICDNSDTLCFAMMQFVTSKQGCSVFQYCCSRDIMGNRLNNGKMNYFFVFKEGKYYRRINETQTEALAAFGIKIIV